MARAAPLLSGVNAELFHALSNQTRGSWVLLPARMTFAMQTQSAGVSVS